MRYLSFPVKVSLIYAIFGILWIFLSDRLLEWLISDVAMLSLIQTMKGWIFVFATTLLLYFLVSTDYKKLLAREREKREIFDATMAAVQHILNNFLNNMLLFKMAAEDSNDFDKETLDLYDDVIHEAETQIKVLSSTQELTAKQIHQSIYPK
jgi:hypothetical protein